MYTPVTEVQFQISDAGIKHTPTGCEFTPYVGSPYYGTRREGYRGSKLPDGRDFDPAELDAVMKRLWADHVRRADLTARRRTKRIALSCRWWNTFRYFLI